MQYGMQAERAAAWNGIENIFWKLVFGFICFQDKE